jgi:hypothetical protein
MILIQDIDLNADTPEFNNPKELVEYLFSLCHKINVPQPDMSKLNKMNNYQIAYSVSKVMYDQMFEESQKATKKECELIGLDLDRTDDSTLEKWDEIDSKYEDTYAVCKFMFLKWQAEQMLVNWSFRAIESDPKIKKQLAENSETFNMIKANWQKPAIRQKVIDLAFKLKA